MENFSKTKENFSLDASALEDAEGDELRELKFPRHQERDHRFECPNTLISAQAECSVGKGEGVFQRFSDASAHDKPYENRFHVLQLLHHMKKRLVGLIQD
jgi:hypothetical protein